MQTNMRLPPLEEPDAVAEKLREKREEKGISQVDLSEKTEIDNSYISRVERGEAESVSYKTIHILWDELRDEPDEPETPAKDVCTEEIVWARPTDQRSDVVEVMMDGNYSQLPVRNENGDHIGSVTESGLIETEEGTIVEEFMREKFPKISHDTKRNIIKELVKRNPAVLVTEEDDYVGIITKTNLIENPE